MKKIIFTLFFLSTLDAHALSPYWLGFGSTTRNFSTAQNDAEGKTVKFKFNPTLFAGLSLPFFYSGLYASPAIGYGRHSGEDESSRSEIILQYHLAQEILPNFFFRYGFSNTISKVSGKGGTILLNNGNSTATFYTPKKSVSSFMASFDLGGEFIVTSSFGTRLQVSVDRFLSSKRRRVSHFLTLNYYF